MYRGLQLLWYPLRSRLFFALSGVLRSSGQQYLGHSNGIVKSFILRYIPICKSQYFRRYRRKTIFTTMRRGNVPRSWYRLWYAYVVRPFEWMEVTWLLRLHTVPARLAQGHGRTREGRGVAALATAAALRGSWHFSAPGEAGRYHK